MIDIYNYITKIFVLLSVIVEAQEVKNFDYILAPVYQYY